MVIIRAVCILGAWGQELSRVSGGGACCKEEPQEERSRTNAPNISNKHSCSLKKGNDLPTQRLLPMRTVLPAFRAHPTAAERVSGSRIRSGPVSPEALCGGLPRPGACSLLGRRGCVRLGASSLLGRRGCVRETSGGRL
eukprot:CAMPEP_0181310348 /NCGR_PEP_ID=MMETSP1101-20121128/12538_1 /TAXON_ID=46948 /ORGANISM="Rhodomonas abbreviata, Strain Caron Lab Isolate" /LENGTH=138 /DNA_ID=CAMNT_0023416971 /DNA_START=183 /DNA_END=599 /DNA_ORIENTATION=+